MSHKIALEPPKCLPGMGPPEFFSPRPGTLKMLPPFLPPQDLGGPKMFEPKSSV